MTGEVVEAFEGIEGVVLDATVGDGGHAAALLDALPKIRLVAADRDGVAVSRAAARLAPFGERAEVVHAAFSEVEGMLRERGVDRLAGLLADLGVSSNHLEDAARGFSFRRAGPLDMRMDPTRGAPLSEKLEETNEEELAEVIRSYGEEPPSTARRIARAILFALPRTETTEDLAAVVARAVGGRRGGGKRTHPATRTFQALRIWVNDELGELDRLLAASPRLLAGGGRLVVLSYHSLEDRAVKEEIRSWDAEGRLAKFSKRVVKPSREEIRANPRARSAKLRWAVFA